MNWSYLRLGTEKKNRSKTQAERYYFRPCRDNHGRCDRATRGLDDTSDGGGDNGANAVGWKPDQAPGLGADDGVVAGAVW